MCIYTFKSILKHKCFVWVTAKKFKNCVNTTSLNKYWFPLFCIVSLCSLISRSPTRSFFQFLTLFTQRIFQSCLGYFSGFLIVFGLNGISVFVLQDISNIYPIPNPNTSPAAFEPIALSSALCITIEYIIKTRLDWIHEKTT